MEIGNCAATVNIGEALSVCQYKSDTYLQAYPVKTGNPEQEIEKIS